MLLLTVGVVIAWILLRVDQIPSNINDCLQLMPSGFVHNETITYHIVNKYVKNRTVGREQAIPYNIFQTNERDEVPWKINHVISSIVEKNPEYTYRYFNGT